MSGYFNPRPPRRGRRVHASDKLLLLSISIHVPREGGDNSAKESIKSAIISIHVPREGGDSRRPSQGRHEQHFNPHPPRRGRLHNPGNLSRSNLFQSTSPAKGATLSYHPFPCRARYFNPRPPRRGRPVKTARKGALHENFNPRPPRRGRHVGRRAAGTGLDISIHVPREGGDLQVGQLQRQRHISIHVPREGGDRGTLVHRGRPRDFNPRPPRRGRRLIPPARKWT